MAGDWIKFQIDTPDKPEVLAMASRLDIDPDAVVGKLIRVWSWFDKHTVDGNAESVTISFLDRLTGVTGFGEQMIFVGWIEQNGSVLKMINFDFHNGKSAKSRALGTKRQKTLRAKSNDVSVTKPLLEKRREENIYTQEFESFWKVYDKPSGKANAFKIWKSIKPDLTLQTTIIKKATIQAKNVERQYRKDAERWLRDRRWEDELPGQSTKNIWDGAI